jgi:hypothetical protein
MLEQLRCDRDVMEDIRSYTEYIKDLISDFEQSFGTVDPNYFGRLITALGRVELGYGCGTMPAHLSFLIGPTTYAWTGHSFCWTNNAEGPLYDLGDFANLHL